MTRTAFAAFCALALCLLANGARAQETQDDPPAPRTIEELRLRIETILDETSTPGIGVAVVSRDETLWVAGLGKADVAGAVDATADTRFRIGSTSKMFVALAVLRLQEQGLVNLDDRVRDLAPEIAFENRWQDTDPVRLVHLIEHTTGFDDIHLVEYASSDPTPLTLREGLDLHPHSRTSRWRPGTRFSYCNAGPALAAYVVERTIGRDFEDHVRETFFEPLGMTTASYRRSEDPERRGATLYQDDGMTPNPYWHIAIRPAGSINASPREMAGLVRLFLGRGTIDGVELVSGTSIDRMERPTSTIAARQGLEAGYGLANYTSFDDGFVFHGHNGGVNGGLTELAYLPDQGLGYVFMINSGNGAAFGRISTAIRGYLTRDLEPPGSPPPHPMPASVGARYSGLYRPASPRQQIGQFLERVFGIQRLAVDDDGTLTTRPLIGGETRTWVGVTDHLARRDDEPVPTLALLETDDDGTWIELRTATMRRVPAWLVITELGIGAATLALMVSAIAFLFVWIPRRLLGRLEGGPAITVRAVPVLAVLALAGAVAAMVIGMGDPFTRLGSPTALAVTVCLLTVLFAILSVAAVVTVFRARRADINRAAFVHAVLVTISVCTWTAYLLYWGLIGLRTWS